MPVYFRVLYLPIFSFVCTWHNARNLDRWLVCALCDWMNVRMIISMILSDLELRKVVPPNLPVNGYNANTFSLWVARKRDGNGPIEPKEENEREAASEAIADQYNIVQHGDPIESNATQKAKFRYITLFVHFKYRYCFC